MRLTLRRSRGSPLVSVFVALALLFASCRGALVPPVVARAGTPEALASSLDLAARRAIFLDAWRMVGEKHFDETMGGVDWPAVRLKYAPRVDAAATTGELRTVLNDMVGELKHSHVAVIPPERGEGGAGPTASAPGVKTAPELEDANGTIGMRTAWLDDSILVTHVDLEGGAAIAGIRAGDVILAIDGKAAMDLTKPLRAHHPERWQGLVPYAVSAAQQGTVATEVDIEVVSPEAAPRLVKAMRQAPALAPMDLGNLGSMAAEFETRTLTGNVLYVRFSPCFTPLQERFETALAEAVDPAGLVLDLRDNPGGLGALAMGIARHFVQDEVELGTMRMRGQKEPLRFLVNPDEQPYRGPIVVLVNGATGSTAEILSAGLQKLGRVRVVGQTSMGAALPSVVETIAHGWRVQAVIANFTLPDGTSVEGIGVVPDVSIVPARADYVGGRDPFVEVALREMDRAPRLSQPAEPAAPAIAVAVAVRPPCEMDAAMLALFQSMVADPRAAKLRTAKTLRLTSRMDVMGMAGPSVTTIQLPDKIHNTSTMAGVGEMLQVFDGVQGWSRNPFEGVRALTREEQAALCRGSRLDVDAWREQFAKLEIVESKRDGEREAIVVRQTPHAGDGEPILLSIDAATLLPFRMQATLRGRMGAMPTVTEISDYADFDGVLLPRRTVSTVGGAVVTTTTEKVEFDVAVPTTLFAKPEKVAKPAKGRQ